MSGVSMDVLEAIDRRSSALRLSEPGPAREDLERILSAGGRAPDHGRLSPWRFVVIEGKARAVLGEAMAEMRRKKAPPPSEEELAREREKPFRAPMIVTVAARVTVNENVPEIEQVVAVGAAVQNMILAAQALGYGAMWRTGAAAYDPDVKQALGLEPRDHIVAFLYLGTALAAGPARKEDVSLLTRWL
jgi:nitroreductase